VRAASPFSVRLQTLPVCPCNAPPQVLYCKIKSYSFGQDYALGKPTADPQALSQMIMKLCEKMGRRLRKAGMVANGMHISCLYQDYTHWHMGRMMNRPMYATIELYRNAQLIFNRQPVRKVVTKLGVSCYGFQPANTTQLDLFETGLEKARKVSDAIDTLNNRYGEFVVTPAIMMGMENLTLDRIAFGSVKELEALYAL
jgi:DNA polymerase-4